jgi:hypothetical protein
MKMIPFGRIAARLGGHNTLLLVTLLCAFAVSPLLGSFSWAKLTLSIILILVMISALLSIRGQTRIFRIGLILGSATLVAMLANDVIGITAAHPYATVFEFAFMAVLAVAIFINVLRSERVTMDTVLGACCVYLMLGMVWAGIYNLIETFIPGSFDFGGLAEPTPVGSLGESEMSRLFYFSFITMTTVGYGDVTPLSPTARTFAALHGLVGQLYIAIVVARLVGLEISNRMSGKD